MNSFIPTFHYARVLVVGDVMLDRYWHGITSRISPEAPVPVLHVKSQEERAGGAGNVALNIAALGGRVTLIGVTGRDDAAKSLFNLLTPQGVHCAFLQLEQVTTITKLRALSRHQQLLRLDFENEFNVLNQEMMANHFLTCLSDAQVLVLSDYGKGTLSDPQSLIAAARRVHKPVLVDPKGRDFTRYQGATLITPNLAEFEAIVGECSHLNTLVERGERLREALQLEALLITRSQEGMTLLRKEYPALHLPAHAREVFDVTGAGDTVIAVLAASLAVGHELVDATSLANLAAGLVVAKLGTATVSPVELEYALHQQSGRGICDITTLKMAVKAAQAQGETVVMTNGCFDILHAGHVHYLTQARQLGDRLIVAVNNDESVRRLKGTSRPINSLSHRMTVLNALECVDWVIPFSEDTPEQLISEILPNILVKGGDYQVDQIAGSHCVLAHGGQVLVLDFVAGYSTTAMIAAIQQATTEEKQRL